jgi:hypothetical protein
MKLPSDLHSFRLAVCCPHAHDGTSLYRGVGPLEAMRRQDRRLELDYAPEGPEGGRATPHWNWIARNDALFLQRPFEEIDIHAAVLARMQGKPVWMDWDDDLTCIPHSNKYRQIYDPATMKQRMGKLLSLADVVSVTTEALKEKMCQVSGAGCQPRIIPNACHWPFSNAQRQRRVTWRGGHSHDADLLAFLPAIAELARLPQFSLWKWCFLGEPPWQVREAIPEANFEQWADTPHMYMPAFGYLGPWVNLVPLADHPFNRSKSNLAWIEATCAGAITLAPDWPEWQRPGVVNYKDGKDFKDNLRGLIELSSKLDSNEGLPGQITASRGFIRENLMLDHVNEQRWEIINQLCQASL